MAAILQMAILTMLPVICFWQHVSSERAYKSVEKVDFSKSCGGIHRVLLHPRLTCIFCDPFDLSDPKIDPILYDSYDLYTVLDGLENPQVWFAAKLNILQQFQTFLPHWSRPMTLTPFLRYIWSYFGLTLTILTMSPVIYFWQHVLSERTWKNL